MPIAEQQCLVRVLRLKPTPVIRSVWQLVRVRPCVLTLVLPRPKSIEERWSAALAPKLDVQELRVQRPPEHPIVSTIKQMLVRLAPAPAQEQCVLPVEYQMFPHQFVKV